MRYLKHAIIVAAALLLTLGLPLYRTGYLRVLAGGSAPDVLTSPSVILDQPSGRYVIYLNHDLHPDEEKWNIWLDFFEGKEIGFLFEDISCAVAKTDPQGYSMAQSYQSRLPENQMKIRQEDAILMLSKAEEGRYDIIIMSKEVADAYHAERLEAFSRTAVLEIKKEA